MDTYSIPELIKNIVTNKLDPSKMVSHLFKLNQIMEAYETIENAKHEKLLKVVLTL